MTENEQIGVKSTKKAALTKRAILSFFFSNIRKISRTIIFANWPFPQVPQLQKFRNLGTYPRKLTPVRHVNVLFLYYILQ